MSFRLEAVEMSNIGNCVLPRGVVACSQPLSARNGRLYCYETDSASDAQNGSPPCLDGDHHRTAAACCLFAFEQADTRDASSSSVLPSVESPRKTIEDHAELPCVSCERGAPGDDADA